MKKNNGLTLDMVTNTATITKAFAKNANDINSAEYKTLRQLREDGFSIVIKAATVKNNKITHKGMTLQWMVQYIENHDNRDTYLDDFKNYVELQKKLNNGHAAYYAKVKKHFLNLFPELTAENIRMEIEAEEAAIRVIEEHEAAKASKKIQLAADGRNTTEAEADEAA